MTDLTNTTPRRLALLLPAAFLFELAAFCLGSPLSALFGGQRGFDNACRASGITQLDLDPDRLVFIECFESKEAHEQHCAQEYTKRFIAFHEQFHRSLTFEIVNVMQPA